MKSYSLYGLILLCLIVNTATAKANQNEDTDSEEKISIQRFETGRWVGSFVGFGVGHAIQKRYKVDKGWIFTAGEAAPFALMLLTLYTDSNQSCSIPDQFNKRCVRDENKPERKSLYNLYAAVFLGFKMWENLDLWTYELDSAHSNKATASLYLTPISENQMGASFVMNF